MYKNTDFKNVGKNVKETECPCCGDTLLSAKDVCEVLCIEDADNSITSLLRPDIAEKFCKTCHGKEALMRFLYFHEKW